MAKLVYPSSMPYDEVNIVDNSVYEDIIVDVNAGIPTGPIAFIPFISPRGYGEDNKLVYMDATRLSRYGTPNLNKYGLSLYLAARFIQGGGTVLGMRVVPAYDETKSTGATYANACVYALVSASKITYGVKAITSGNVAADFKTASAEDLEITVAEGETLYKLFVIRAKAAGNFANSFYFTINADATMNTAAEEEGLDAFFYKFADSDGGETLDGNLVFTFAEDFLYNEESMDPVDVFDDYSENVVFEKITGDNGFAAFMTAIKADGSVDFITASTYVAKDETGVATTTYTVDNTALAGTTISLSGAIDIWGGKTFDWDNDPFAEALAVAYGNAGEAPATDNPCYNDLIYDQARYPFQYMFAPTYDSAVMLSMHKLVQDRHITHANYIVPYKATYAAQITNWKAVETASQVILDDWREVFVPEWCYVRDVYTGKKIKVPAVYMDAYGYPKHWIERQGRPYAGLANYSWTDYETNTVMPCTSSAAQLIANHNARFNTMVEDGNGVAVPYEQITRQTKTSALSEINNTYVLTDMIRIALAIANQKRWTDLTDAAVEAYKDEVLNTISAELGASYDRLTVISTRESANGAGRNRIACTLNVKFKDILKGVTYTFYIAAN